MKPPAYTGLAPILLKVGDETPVSVPTGSTLEAHVTGGSRTPRLALGDATEDFRRIDGGGFAVTHVLTTPGPLSVRRGWSTLSRWNIAIIPDNPPTIEFGEPPSPMQSGAVKIDYHATDDYGVAAVELRVRRVPGGPEIAADPIVASLASEQTEKELRGSSFQDLDCPSLGRASGAGEAGRDRCRRPDQRKPRDGLQAARAALHERDGAEYRRDPQACDFQRCPAFPARHRNRQHRRQPADIWRGSQRVFWR